VLVDVFVGVLVMVAVEVTVGVLLGVLVGVTLAVLLGVAVKVGVQVWPKPSVQGVLLGVPVKVEVGAGADGEEGLFLLGQPMMKRALPNRTEINPNTRNFITSLLDNQPSVIIPTPSMLPIRTP
jgi:hypothetical protein